LDAGGSPVLRLGCAMAVAVAGFTESLG